MLIKVQLFMVVLGVSIVRLGIVMVPTPGRLELETHSILSSSLLLTISPSLGIAPDDISVSEERAYIPAPETEHLTELEREKKQDSYSPTTLTRKTSLFSLADPPSSVTVQV